MSQANPFIPPGREYGSVDTESRLRALEDFNLEQCRAALALPDLQKTVEKKLRTRIRALEKLETTAEQASGTGVSEYDALFAAISSAVEINSPISLSISVDRFKRCVADLGFSVAALTQPSPAPEMESQLLDVSAERNAMQRQRDTARGLLERECDDADELIRLMGFDPEQYRTDGGSINLPKLRASVAQAGQVPEGWKLVPIEPTKEMMLNGSSCQHHDHDDMSCIQRQMRRGIWSKMLAAAPAEGGE